MVNWVSPSENDVGGASSGENITEAIWNNIHKTQLNYALSGLTYTINTPSDGDVRISPGVAIISGYAVNVDANVDVTITANTWAQLWLQLTFSDGLVTGYEFVQQTADAPLDDALLLAEFRNMSTPIIDYDFDRAVSKSPLMAMGKYNFTLSADPSHEHKIRMGFRPKILMIHRGELSYDEGRLSFDSPALGASIDFVLSGSSGGYSLTDYGALISFDGLLDGVGYYTAIG